MVVMVVMMMVVVGIPRRLRIIIVMMVVMMMTGVVVIAVTAVIIILGQLNVRFRFPPLALVTRDCIGRFELLHGIGNGFQQLGIGIGARNRLRGNRSMSRRQGSDRQNAG